MSRAPFTRTSGVICSLLISGVESASALAGFFFAFSDFFVGFAAAVSASVGGAITTAGMIGTSSWTDGVDGRGATGGGDGTLAAFRDNEDVGIAGKSSTEKD